MLKRIIVPLDGSEFGEQAIPVALRIAERDGAEIELVHVFEAILPSQTQGAPPLDPRLDFELKKERGSYLQSVAQWLRGRANVSVQAVVIDGSPVAEALVAHIASRRADLVVMTTHGRGGLSRLWLGSVANDVVRESMAPVMLVRPDEKRSRTDVAQRFSRIVIPLDGSPVAEEAIDHALEIAGDASAEFLLVHVIAPIIPIGEPPAVPLPSDIELREAAERYLGSISDTIQARGFAVDTRVMLHPSAVRAILDVVDEVGADLIAMETYGRSGIARLVMGSVADKVVRASPVPVLLHRPSRISESTRARPATAARKKSAKKSRSSA